MESGIATDPAALGSSNVFALSGLTIPTLYGAQQSELSLMAPAIARGSEARQSKVSSSAKVNILENIFAISRDPTNATLLEAPTGRFARP